MCPLAFAPSPGVVYSVHVHRTVVPAPEITIDLNSAVPVRRQIVDRLRSVLISGGLRPGDELPSARRVAIDLGIHFNTVAEAYRTLAAEGWIEVAHGRAARVRQREKPDPPGPDALGRFRRRLLDLMAEMRAQGFSPARISREVASVLEALK